MTIIIQYRLIINNYYSYHYYYITVNLIFIVIDINNNLRIY